MTFAVFCACFSWGGSFGLLVVYASRGLRLTRVDARLGAAVHRRRAGRPDLRGRGPLASEAAGHRALAAAFLAANVVALLLLAVAPG